MRRSLRPAAAAGGLLLGVAGAAPAELPRLTETVEVRVVNVDVVVTDRQGNPIVGLRPEDFELRVNGKPVAIKYFSAIRDGARRPVGGSPAVTEVGETGEAGDADSELEYKPYLAIVFDERSFGSLGAQKALTALRERLEQLVDSSRGVMVVRHGRQLSLGQSFTRNPELVARALDAVEEERGLALDWVGTDSLLRRMERATPATANPSLLEPSGNEEITGAAIAFLNDIRAEAQSLHYQTTSAMRDLSRFIASLAGLPGRKSVLYFSPGFNTRPAEILYRLWWSKFSALGPLVGLDSVETEIARFRNEEDVVRLIEHASENRVSFYVFDPGGARLGESSARFSSRLATELIGSQDAREQESLVSLATGTGGIGRVNTLSLDPLLDRMVDDFRTYYSLGFEPAEDAPDRGRIDVRVARPGTEVRHLERFAAPNARRQLEERTLAALLTEEGRNPLHFGVELEPAERRKDGLVVMPLLLKVPISRVTLLPEETHHVGRLEVVVIAQAESGDLSEPAHGEMPIEIDNRELLDAMSRIAGYRMRLLMREGEQRVAIGIRDQITGEDSTLNLVVDASDLLH